MELKPYQQQVIDDLARFMECVQQEKRNDAAFRKFWLEHPRGALQPQKNTAIEPYKNNVVGTTHICIKVPTAGGKTFIACNALRTLFDGMGDEQARMVVWLVPSIAIREQTIAALKDEEHAYRLKLNQLFQHRIGVFSKEQLLQGEDFNSSSVQERLNIVVMSFDSLRAKNKEDRKVYQENGALHSFGSLLENDTDITLMNVLQHLKPIVIVDESHNAESELSIEMLSNLNPSFILDLTATPKKNSNIIAFVDSMALKRENMVKLPVIVYNHPDKTEVINTALDLQRQLEAAATIAAEKGGKYIRPIVLFQAQARTNDDNTTFEKIKETLIKAKIPSEQIAIKVSGKDELKGKNLASPDCPIRYIITVDALKEGWDCPFAYILASLADKYAPIGVEQILGRILRQPYVQPHSQTLLNCSFVLTASAQFLNTLQSIVDALNKAGFSRKDYRSIDTVKPRDNNDQLAMAFGIRNNHQANIIESDEISAEKIIFTPTLPQSQDIAPLESVQQIVQQALLIDTELQEKIQSDNTYNPPEIQSMLNEYTILPAFQSLAKSVCLPQFHIKVDVSDIFGGQKNILLASDNLMEGFDLGKADANISFSKVTELYRIDLEENSKDNLPKYLKIDGTAKNLIMDYLLSEERKDNRIKDFTHIIVERLGNMYPISDGDLKKYVARILQDFKDDDFQALAMHQNGYIETIKLKIRGLSRQHREEKFYEWVETGRCFTVPSYTFPKKVTFQKKGKDIAKSLYENEGDMNGFEERVMNEIASLDNIVFWTRNGVKGNNFAINGANDRHFPDFVLYTKSEKIIVLETKGDDRANEDSQSKNQLGKKWAAQAGEKYRYFMVFDKNDTLKETYTLEKFLGILSKL